MIGSGTQKLEWHELPPETKAEIEARLGARVVTALTQVGGFSPGIAAKILTDRAGEAFVKCVSASLSEHAAAANRREINCALALQGNPRVPKLLHSFDKDGWVGLIYEVVQGKHPQ